MAIYLRPEIPVLYRAAIVAADVLLAPAVPTLAEINEVGVFPDVDYYCTVIAVNAYGQTTGTDAAAVINLSAANKVIKVGITQRVGATRYGVYLSADADPKCLAWITEAQRAAGCAITAQDTVVAGGAVNSAYCYLAGVGLLSGATAAQNTAYVLPADTINCFGHVNCYFDLFMSRTGDTVSPSLVVIPFFYDSVKAAYVAGNPETVAFGGGGGAYQPMHQRLQLETWGDIDVRLVVAYIAGTGASLDIYYVLS